MAIIWSLYYKKTFTPSLIKFSFFIAILTLFNFNHVFAESVKWQPGHYMRFKSNHSESIMEKFLSNPYTKGILVQFSWASLEPQFGKYNFSQIDNFINLVSKYNKYLILDIEIKCFYDGCTSGNSPSYLKSDPKYNGGVELLYRSNGTVKGSTSRIWDSNVADRIISLINKIGTKYDNNQNVVGVILPGETALGFEKTPDGYSAGVYENQLKRIATSMSKSFPKTIGIIGINFFPGSSDPKSTFTRIANQLLTNGNGGLTHPDTYPQNPVPESYQVEIAFKNKLPIIPQFQTWSVPIGTSEEEIYLYAVNTLGSQFVVWNNYFSSKFKEERPNYIENYVLPVINKYKGRTSNTFPTGLNSFDSESNTNVMEAPELRIISYINDSSAMPDA